LAIRLILFTGDPYTLLFDLHTHTQSKSKINKQSPHPKKKTKKKNTPHDIQIPSNKYKLFRHTIRISQIPPRAFLGLHLQRINVRERRPLMLQRHVLRPDALQRAGREELRVLDAPVARYRLDRGRVVRVQRFPDERVVSSHPIKYWVIL
jgi:hypothetical protein